MPKDINEYLPLFVLAITFLIIGYMGGYDAGRAEVYQKIMYEQVWKKPETIQESTCIQEKP